MSYPRETLAIRSPTEVRTLLDALERAIKEGLLIECQPASASTPTTKLASIFAADSRWPDYIEAYVRDPATGNTFRLAVETYHGSGGTWERI